MLLTMEGEGLSAPSPVLPLLDSLLIPLSECWVIWGGQCLPGGVQEGCFQGTQLPWAEGLVQGCPSLPSTCNVPCQGRALG